MSTKVTIKHHYDCGTGIGFHLYQDTKENDDEGNAPVHLELSGVEFEVDGEKLSITIPWDMAEELGLI